MCANKLSHLLPDDDDVQAGIPESTCAGHRVQAGQCSTCW